MRWFVKLFIFFVVFSTVVIIIKWLVDSWISKLSSPPRFDGIVFVLGLLMVRDLAVSASGDSGSKLLSCVFWSDVLCSFRKYDGSGLMGRCLKCFHCKRFLSEMGEADERIMDEIDEICRTGVWQ